MRFSLLFIAVFVLVSAPIVAMADEATWLASGSHPAWSPDGSQIAFTYAINEPQIWVIPAVGGSATQLTPDGTGFYSYYDPCWSPDGSQIALVQRYFDVWINHEIFDISVIPAGGGTPTTIPLSGLTWSTFDPCWNGSQIAFAHGDWVYSEVWVVEATGGSPTQITTDRGWDPSWSPDGSLIAFDSCRNANPNDPRNWDVWVMPASGGAATRVAYGGRDPAWSPDGCHIAYASVRSDNSDIWAVRIDPGSPPPPPTRITSDPAFDLQPCWSPDGSQIAFTRSEGGYRGYSIYVIAAPGPIAIDQESWGSIKNRYR